MFKLPFALVLLSSTLWSEYLNMHGEKQALTKLQTHEVYAKSRATQNDTQHYKTTSNQLLTLNNKLIISFDDLSIQLYIEKEFSLKLVESLSKNSFLYTCQDASKTLSLTNQLSAIKGIGFSHPDFAMPKTNRTNDPLFNQTWHLDANRGINAESAWLFTKGAGVTVAVYDEGIDLEHEDLRDNILGYGNFNHEDGQIDIVDRSMSYPFGFNVPLNNRLYNAPAPAENSDIWHGTSCSGLIVAVGDNGRGSVGVAPEAKLLAVRYANKSTSQDAKAYDAMAQNGAAVISNSWGTYSLTDELNAKFRDLSQYGRNGRGILIFFAAGNDNCDMDQFFSTDSQGYKICEEKATEADYPAIHDESESPYVISIAASSQDGRIASYSNYGSSIDFTAPGSDPKRIITTDAMGSKGTTSGDYTDGFSGTSAAAPIAAGVAVLIISENPLLTKEEVLDILKSTTQKRGRYPYEASGRNDHWGYGLIDAGAAVRLASEYGKASKLESFAQKIYKNMH